MKPFLAATIKDLGQLSFPLVASPKLDGIRALVYHGALVSRSLKPIPNAEAQATFSKLPHGWDGELIVGDPAAKDCFQRTTSQVMSRDGGIESMRFFVFDDFSMGGGHGERMRKVLPSYALKHETLLSAAEVEGYETSMLRRGYEGIMLRNPYAPYKYGRSTMREQGLMKLKRFADSEARVVGMEELMHNANEAFIGELGQTKRSSHKAGQQGMGILGALVVQWKGKRFNIGTGFTAKQRKLYWKTGCVDMIVKFKYLEVGMKDLPRHPVFLGFRDPRDK